MAANRGRALNDSNNDVYVFLPLEVITNILRFLPASEIKTAATVCFLWAKASEDPILWRGVCAVLGTKNERFSEELLESLHKRCIQGVRFRHISRAAQIVQVCKHLGSNLKQISLEQCRSVTGHLVETVAKVSPDLESLDLSRCRQLEISSEAIWTDTCGAFWRRLQKLDLNACRDITDRTVAKVAANFPNLSTLGLSGCKQINTCTWDLLAQKVPGLTSLDISRSDISDHQLLYLAKISELALKEVNVSACKQLTDNGIVGLAKFQVGLRVLKLACVEVTNTSLIAIGKHLQYLELLDLNSCRQITDPGFRASGSKGLLSGLHSLNLYSCYQLTSATLEEFLCSSKEPNTAALPLRSLVLNGCSSVADSLVCRVSQVAHNLLDLDLSSCIHLTNKGLLMINASLTNLHSLRLSWCANITDEGLLGTPHVRQTAKSTNPTNEKNKCYQKDTGIANLKNLTVLDLSHCMAITDVGVQELCKLKELDSLNLNMCVKITDSSLHSITANLRGLKHLSVSGCSVITDDGLIAVGRDLRHLIMLDVSKCDSITDLSILNLAKYALHLAQLDLSMCSQVTGHGVDELETSLPGLASLQLRYSGAQASHHSGLFM